MDYLKTQAPFWKKEVSKDGSKWVESKDSDQDRIKQHPTARILFNASSSPNH
jgi:molybdopterin synthase catalytic subunit